MIVDAYLATARVAATLLRQPGIGHHWTDVSALPEYRISGLAGHLAMSVFRVAQWLDEPVPSGAYGGLRVLAFAAVTAGGFFLARPRTS